MTVTVTMNGKNMPDIIVVCQPGRLGPDPIAGLGLVTLKLTCDSFPIGLSASVGPTLIKVRPIFPLQVPRTRQLVPGLGLVGARKCLLFFKLYLNFEQCRNVTALFVIGGSQ